MASAEYMRAHYAKRRLLGLCMICGQAVEGGGRLCASCHARDNGRARLRKRQIQVMAMKEGTCTKCRRPRLATGLVCEWHYLLNRAYLALGSTSYASDIKQKLLDQGLLCYYTGVPLVLGINDSLDHVLSVSQHPELRADIGNVVWCTREINTMKNGMDRDEFLAMCRLLTSRWPD